MKDRAQDVEALLKMGRGVMASLESGATVDVENMKRKFEAIRVHNTTLRTELSIAKVKMALNKLSTK